MKNRINALIIDKDRQNHDYTGMSSDNTKWEVFPDKDNALDIAVISDDKNIYAELSKIRNADVIVTVGGSTKDYSILNNASIEYRKKWIHEPVYDKLKISEDIISAFLHNINRDMSAQPAVFSIFTCTFNTPKSKFERLYESLKSQTYTSWNWFILDDSTNPYTAEMIAKTHDSRITVFKNINQHGNIGYNKHTVAMACSGDYLVEVDHDDALTPDCLATLAAAIREYPDSDFLYSHALELVGDNAVWYDENFALGLGCYRTCNVNGIDYNVALTPDINELSVRAIYTMPNHVRVWRKDFYHRIGGHNCDLSVCDDLELLMRTFLYGKMTKIDKVLYIQYEDDTVHRRDAANTQGRRFDEIQRMNVYLRHIYDGDLHKRVLELGGKELYWDEKTSHYDVHEYMFSDKSVELKTLCNLF